MRGRLAWALGALALLGARSHAGPCCSSPPTPGSRRVWRAGSKSCAFACFAVLPG